MATATAPVVTSRSQVTIVFFVVFFALTFLAAYNEDARVLEPASPIAQHFAPVKWYVVAHGSSRPSQWQLQRFSFPIVCARYLPVHRALGGADEM
jgi:hypothetical protein